jgi:hypothetical protein
MKGKKKMRKEKKRKGTLTWTALYTGIPFFMRTVGDINVVL